MQYLISDKGEIVELPSTAKIIHLPENILCIAYCLEDAEKASLVMKNIIKNKANEKISKRKWRIGPSKN